MNFFKVTRRSLCAGAVLLGLIGLSLVLTIGPIEGIQAKHEHMRGNIWAGEREMLMKRPTLAEMNRNFGIEGKRVTNNGMAAYVWPDLALPGVTTRTFADDGRLNHFERISDPQWRSDIGTYSARDKRWDYSESRGGH